MRGTHFMCLMNKKINSLIIFYSCLYYSIFVWENKVPPIFAIKQLIRDIIFLVNKSCFRLQDTNIFLYCKIFIVGCRYARCPWNSVSNGQNACQIASYGSMWRLSVSTSFGWIDQNGEWNYCILLHKSNPCTTFRSRLIHLSSLFLLVIAYGCKVFYDGFGSRRPNHTANIVERCIAQGAYTLEVF